MTEVLLFHHAQGLTPGVREFAATLVRAGHVVHTPDLYDGRTFDNLEDGIGYARETGFDTIVERGRQAAEGLPAELVYAGFSLGVMPAQLLAQTRPGALGALFFSACLPVSEYGDGWPVGVPVQIHGMEGDELFAGEDLEAARELVAGAEEAELFLYAGKEHLFADSSLPSFEERAAALMTDRVVTFLGVTVPN